MARNPIGGTPLGNGRSASSSIVCHTRGRTHITPGTKPNNFNTADRNIVGGYVQDKGLETALTQLTSIVSMVALFYCKYFEFDDLFELIVKLAKIDERKDGDSTHAN